MRIVLDMNPVPASRARVSKYGTYHLPTYRKFLTQAKEALKKIMRGQSIDRRPLSVAITCCVQTPKKTERSWPRGDVDNYAKAVLDSMSGIVFEDDDQVLELTVNKSFAKKGEIVIETSPIKRRKSLKVSKVRKHRRGSKR